ncbi:MAG: SpoIIE family protein phosphatase [Chloroflexi bacterium]|nr:SpoIIE family protein phosphatase [Chloroflexota bacterium]
MLELKDFFHLPQVDALLEQLVVDEPGLVLVAGFDPDPSATAWSSLRYSPSGRSTFFGILARQMLMSQRNGRAIVVAESKDAVRIPSSLRRQVEWAFVKYPLTYAEQLNAAIRRRPETIILDQLNTDSAPLALDAARANIRVLTQVNCVFRGADVARYLLDLGVRDDLLAAVRWIVTVDRLPKLCSNCKQPASVDADRLRELTRLYAGLAVKGTFFKPGRCSTCQNTGRLGDLAIYDIFRAGRSELAMEEYALRLADAGEIWFDDYAERNSDQLHRTFLLLRASERALSASNLALQKKVAELEAANRVLKQKTDSLISLEDIAHALITTTEPDDLANRINRFAYKLCGADRSILYLLQSDGMAEILSVSGWDAALVHQRLDAMQVFGAANMVPASYDGHPPGIPWRSADVEGAKLRAGLRVPLIAQNEVVGLLIVHTTRKARFTPGEVALVQTFANQAAIAIQRAGLIESLRDKVARLEAAQIELVQKERLERELELAREVQQRLLPQSFPELPGYAFAAQSEPARRVGGDFYDVFRLDAQHFGFAIADVSDKGMPAALFMALTRSLLLAEARREVSPRKVVQSVHRLLMELGEPDMFVTVFYGVVDTATRELTYVRAGHEPPILLRDGETRLLLGRGTFLGLLDDSQVSWTEERIALRGGDRLALYTDGLCDAVAPDGERFGAERVASFLQTQPRASPADLCAGMFAAIKNFAQTAEQFDDMAMLVIHVEGDAHG